MFTTTQMSGSQRMDAITEYCTLAKRNGFVPKKRDPKIPKELPPQPRMAMKYKSPNESIDS